MGPFRGPMSLGVPENPTDLVVSNIFGMFTLKNLGEMESNLTTYAHFSNGWEKTSN